MPKFAVPEYQKQRPMIQMAPLIDIVFLTLVFFMTISVFNQMESELSISVPKSKAANESARSAGKIIINVTSDGHFIVNQQEVTSDGLEEMLKKVSALFPNQQVIIRADENAYHKYVVAVLDACMRSNIWDISFSTVNEDKIK